MIKFCVKEIFANSDVQIIRFPFRRMNEAIDYSQAHKDKTIIMEIIDLQNDKMPDIKTLRSLQEQTGFIYDFYNFVDFVTYGKMTEPFSEEISEPEPHTIYWRKMMYHYPATTWALIKICTYYRATDIVVGEPLVFQAEELAKIRKMGFSIHAYPCVGMNISLAETGENGLRHFWVLPQHMPLYENYIDVFEFEPQGREQVKSILDLYTRPFNYSLDLLIENFPCEVKIYGSNITEDFIKRRLNCGQRCLSPNEPCHACLMPMYEKKLHKTIKK